MRATSGQNWTLPAPLMCSNEAGHLFAVSVSKQDIRCRICKLGIHFVGRPTECEVKQHWTFF